MNFTIKLEYVDTLTILNKISIIYEVYLHTMHTPAYIYMYIERVFICIYQGR